MRRTGAGIALSALLPTLTLVAACGQENEISHCGYLYAVSADGKTLYVGACAGTLNPDAGKLTVRLHHRITVVRVGGIAGLPVPTPVDDGVQLVQTSGLRTRYTATRLGASRLNASTIHCASKTSAGSPPVATICPVVDLDIVK